MSRIGKNPIVLAVGVSVEISNDEIKVKGGKGELQVKYSSNDVKIVLENNQVIVSPVSKTLKSRKLWGTLRAIINNMVIGVSVGFVNKLHIIGVGYRSVVQGNNLVLNLGFSHEVIYQIPKGIKVTCTDSTHINVEGIDKQKVGQVAAQIRSHKKPEPYKGKGIKYENETILRKEGKKK